MGVAISFAVARWLGNASVEHVQRIGSPAPTTTVGSLLATFHDGTQLVGGSIQPGVYVSSAGMLGCSWERLSGLSGSLEEILASGDPAGQAIVEVRSTDAAFSSRDCGSWSGLVDAQPVVSFGDGDWAVHHNIAPGRWAAAGAAGCRWERATGYAHERGEIVAEYSGEGQVSVDIAPTDVRFSTAGCGTWINAD